MGRLDDDPTDRLDDRANYASNGTKRHEGDELSYVTPEEVNQLAEHTTSVRDELLIKLLFQTGMRRGEVGLVELDDIDRHNRSITVHSPKTESKRTVFYQGDLDILLQQWVNVYREKYKTATTSPHLFVSQRSERIDGTTVNQIVKKAAEAAGIQEELYTDARGNKRYRITAHTLRHGHAVHAIKCGIHIKAVSDHMGHSKLETTQQYLQLVDDDVGEAYTNWKRRGG